MMFIILFACNSPQQDSARVQTSVESSDPISFSLQVLVHHNNIPIKDATVQQPGREKKWYTDENGRVDIEISTSVVGELAVSTWSDGYHIRGDDFKIEDIDVDNLEPMEIELEPLPTADNIDYQFQHPGTPEIN